jgi:S-(hydroxymethyl)glutathione dehydrogenase/alcohol dehydrogenase
MFLSEKKIQGSNMGSNRFRTDMPRYVDMYLNGKLKLDELVSPGCRSRRSTTPSPP